LELFGIPYLVSPSESDAQCAVLEQLGLVDGIISDDSDIFLFGGRNVYKHVFDKQHEPCLFSMDDIERNLGTLFQVHFNQLNYFS
jgi:DNA excision repair protein ERCC-5